MTLKNKVRDWLGIIDLSIKVSDVRNDVLNVRMQLGGVEDKLNVIADALQYTRIEDDKRWLGNTRLQGKISGHVAQIQKVVTSVSEAVGHIEDSLNKEPSPKPPKSIVRRQWSEDTPAKDSN